MKPKRVKMSTFRKGDANCVCHCSNDPRIVLVVHRRGDGSYHAQMECLTCKTFVGSDSRISTVDEAVKHILQRWADVIRGMCREKIKGLEAERAGLALRRTRAIALKNSL